MARFPSTRIMRLPFLTGPFFDDPFYASPPPPPYGLCDPCFQTWQATIRAAMELPVCLGEGQQTDACSRAQSRYVEAARSYADCMDQTYGLGLFRSPFSGVHDKK